jgi:hypothetical protein
MVNDEIAIFVAGNESIDYRMICVNVDVARNNK